MKQSPSKKRKKVTQKKYLEFENPSPKTPKIIILDNSNDYNNTNSNSGTMQNDATDSNSLTSPSTDSTPYAIVNYTDGVDMSILCDIPFQTHQPNLKIAKVITTSRNSSFQLVEKSNDNVSTVPNDNNRILTRSMRGNVNTSDDNDSIENETKFPIESLLYHKNRCVVEDFLLVEEKTAVVVMIPKNKFQYSSNLINVKSLLLQSNLIQFGGKRSIKYYILDCIVASNPFLNKFKDNDISITEMQMAFENDISQIYTVNLNINKDTHDKNSPTTSNDTLFNISWFDVLRGRKNGIQVWAYLSKKRNFTDNFLNISKNNKTPEEESLKLLSFLSEELHCDKEQSMLLLNNYYVMCILYIYLLLFH